MFINCPLSFLTRSGAQAGVGEVRYLFLAKEYVKKTRRIFNKAKISYRLFFPMQFGRRLTFSLRVFVYSPIEHRPFIFAQCGVLERKFMIDRLLHEKRYISSRTQEFTFPNSWVGVYHDCTSR